MMNADTIMFIFLGGGVIMSPNPDTSFNTVTDQWIKDPNMLELGVQWPPLTVIKFSHNESHSLIP